MSNKTVPGVDGTEAGIQKVLSHKYYIDEFYDNLVTRPLNFLSIATHRFVEISGIDALVNLTGKGVVATGKYVRYFQSGNTGVYLISMVIGVILLIIFNTY